MKILKVIRCFVKAIWQYVKYVCQKAYHVLNQHNPDYVLSEHGKVPTYLITKVEMGNSLSLDELERL